MILCCIVADYPAMAARHAMHASANVIVVVRDRVAARTPALRDIGIPLGESIDRARAMAPDAVVVERRPALEQAVWDEVLDRCFMITPYLQSLRPGMFMASFDDRRAFQHILDDVQGQGGVAETRTAALLGAVRARPGRMLDVPMDDLARFLAAWPVELLAELDVETSTIERMQLFGLGSIGSLRMLTRRQLHAQFGDDGLRVHDLLSTLSVRDVVPLYEPPPVIEEDVHFEDPQREPGVVETHLLLALDRAYARLGRLRCNVVEVRSRDRSQAVVIRAQRILRRPAETLSELRTTATILLRDIIGPQRYCSSIGIALKGLQPARVDQLALFAPRPSADDVARAVLRRYPDGVSRIRVVAPDAYLPEQAFVTERWTLQS